MEVHTKSDILNPPTQAPLQSDRNLKAVIAKSKAVTNLWFGHMYYRGENVHTVNFIRGRNVISRYWSITEQLRITLVLH